MKNLLNIAITQAKNLDLAKEFVKDKPYIIVTKTNTGLEMHVKGIMSTTTYMKKLKDNRDIIEDFKKQYKQKMIIK